MDPEKTEERTTVITVEDAKIKFAKVYRPERTKTIQTIDTTASSKRPSISAPKRPGKKKDTKKNVDIVRYASLAYSLTHLFFFLRLNIYSLQKNVRLNIIRTLTSKRLLIQKDSQVSRLQTSWPRQVQTYSHLLKRDIRSLNTLIVS
jgi:sodium/potassium-transporting ATPase subunit alpha